MIGFHPFAAPFPGSAGRALVAVTVGLALAGCLTPDLKPVGHTGNLADAAPGTGASDGPAPPIAPEEGGPDRGPTGGGGTGGGGAGGLDGPPARTDAGSGDSTPGGGSMLSLAELADRCGKYCDCMANHNKSQCKDRTPPDCRNSCLREGGGWNLDCRYDKCRVAMTDYQDQITGDCLAAVGVNACFDH